MNLTEDDYKELNKLHAEVEEFNNRIYGRVGEIMNPLLKGISNLTIEELESIVNRLPGFSFYRAEIRSYMNKKKRGEVI